MPSTPGCSRGGPASRRIPGRPEDRCVTLSVLQETNVATVRLDIKTETALKRLSVRRGQTQSEVIRDAIARLAGEEGEQPLSAFQRLQPFIGIADSGGQQLSERTGQRFRELLAERKRARGTD